MNIVESLKDIIRKVEDEEQLLVEKSETKEEADEVVDETPEEEAKAEEETVEKEVTEESEADEAESEEVENEEEIVEEEVLTIEDLVKDLGDNESFKELIKSLFVELQPKEETKEEDEIVVEEPTAEKTCKCKAKVEKSRTSKINLGNDKIVETKYDLYKATGRDINGIKKQ